jgi:ribosomal protein S6--L-glutamate ligase
MKLGVILTRHPPGRISPIVPETVRLLREWRAEVELIRPEDTLIDVDALADECDLYVFKSGTELALSVAGALHVRGATLLNPYPVAVACRDKVVSARVLQAAGIPTPATYVTGELTALAPLLDSGPLVVKPHRGSQGRGVSVVRDAHELEEIEVELGTVLAQRYHEPDGRDRKIYCIGGHVFGVMRRWPVRTYRDKLGEPFTVSDELRDIALRCGRAFGLELYGLDVIVSEGRPYVVDVSSFPGFKGVPDAALRLADYVYAAARRVMEGEPTPAHAEGVLA